MLTPIGIALKSVYEERTGSWKTCMDFWLAIRTDGCWHKAETLNGAAERLVRRLAKLRAEAAARREDEDAIADLG